MAIYTTAGRQYVTISGRGYTAGVGDHIEYELQRCVVTAVRLELSADRSDIEYDIVPVKWADGRWVCDEDAPLLKGGA